MLFWQRLLLKFYVIIFAIVFASCSSELTPNEEFRKKYGKEISRMNSGRDASKKDDKKEPLQFSAPNNLEIEAQEFQESGGYYPYVDIKKFGEKYPQEHLPNIETYYTSGVYDPAKKLPPDIFDLNYDTALYSEFSKSGLEFDQIIIPPKDSYGVTTALAEKQYSMVGNDVLQKGVDSISAKRKSQDVEFSKILIKEQKDLNREQKIIKIIGSNKSLNVIPLDSE